MAITDRARENREYVRTLLKEKQPELAALLEQLELELPVPADQRAQHFQLGVTPGYPWAGRAPTVG